MMSSGFERFYSVAAICSVDATTNMHRKKTEHKPRNTLSWLWFSKKQNIVSPPQAPKKYDFRPFHFLFAFQNLKKSACGATKKFSKSYTILSCFGYTSELRSGNHHYPGSAEHIS
jgi:hypothetical protein